MRGEMRVFRDPAGGISAPTGIIAAPDGDIWFTSIANGRVGRLRPSTGEIETFVAPAGGVALPANIFPGADGRMWFTCLGSNRLGAIDPSAPDPAATLRTYGHPDLDKPVALKTAGGRLWFTLRGADALGCLDPAADDPAASIRIYRHPDVAAPAALIPGPDGRIWWVNGGSSTIGHLDPAAPSPAATIATVRIPPGVGGLRAWTVDHAGRLWLTTQNPPGLVRLDTGAADPEASLTHATDPRLRSPDGIWTSADGALWFVDTALDALVRWDATGPGEPDVSVVGGPPDVDGPFDIKSGSDPADGYLWFTNKHGNSIGRVAT